MRPLVQNRRQLLAKGDIRVCPETDAEIASGGRRLDPDTPPTPSHLIRDKCAIDFVS